mgnify:CR=1 FL=1
MVTPQDHSPLMTTKGEWKIQKSSKAFMAEQTELSYAADGRVCSRPFKAQNRMDRSLCHILSSA